MRKILIVGMTDIAGGVESFLKNYYEYIDKQIIQFDFLSITLNSVAYENELKELGALVYHIVPKRKNYFQHIKDLKKFFELHAKEYAAIWVNINSLVNIDYFKLAKKYLIPVRIVHSHNSDNMGGIIQWILHKYNRTRIKNYATDFWACSNAAAEWFYTADILSEIKIIHNAIDVNRFLFDAKKRIVYREILGWSDKYIIGNVGRLHFQKNQDFIIDIFNKLLKKDKNFRLVLIGEGDDESKLKKSVNILGIEKYVNFLGRQNDISGWMSAFDVLFFPSRFEGLSIVGLEAQANGLPIVASDKAICDEGKLNSNIKLLPLNADSDYWINALIEYANKDIREKNDNIVLNFQTAGFNIKDESDKLVKFFNEYI
ncbi:MAG: glycosyltransferase family 1 protein [Ruminococcus flavefaciens]|nr:glycosyltransferase family 1 protein [Ruminococcus flavefaciens]